LVVSTPDEKIERSMWHWRSSSKKKTIFEHDKRPWYHQMISYRSQELGGQITAPVAPESSPSPGSTSPPALGHWHRDALHARRYHGPRHASDECTWRGGRA
jgi:hypothetical protein